MITTNNRAAYRYARVSTEKYSGGYGMSRQADNSVHFVKNQYDK